MRQTPPDDGTLTLRVAREEKPEFLTARTHPRARRSQRASVQHQRTASQNLASIPYICTAHERRTYEPTLNGSQAEGEIKQQQREAKTQFSALRPSLPHHQITPSPSRSTGAAVRLIVFLFFSYARLEVLAGSWTAKTPF